MGNYLETQGTQKWPKMAKNGQNYPKFADMGQNKAK